MYLYYVAIVKSLIGSPDSVTNAVNISRIPILYNDLVTTIKALEFLDLGLLFKVHT